MRISGTSKIDKNESKWGIFSPALLSDAILKLYSVVMIHMGCDGRIKVEKLSKKIQNGCFSKLSVRVSGYKSLGCSWALISAFSSYARTEEDRIVSRVESGQYAVLERVAGAAQTGPRRSGAPKIFQMFFFKAFGVHRLDH